jgi:hypothetical protein
MKIAKIVWSETMDYTAYVEVPDDFDLDKYQAGDAMADSGLNDDAHFDGCSDRTVQDIEFVTRIEVPSNEDVEEIEWEAFCE